MIITTHSYKGGTGKTFLSINLALILASRGNNVCLLDMDFRAPSLISYFKNRKKYWINDYLNKVCNIDNVLSEWPSSSDIAGKLLIGFTDPSIDTIRQFTSKGKKWELECLSRLLSLKNTLLNELKMDYVICDCSPGISYATINQIVIADLVFIVTTLDMSDTEGTKKMVNSLCNLYSKKTGFLINKVPEIYFSGQASIKLDNPEIPIIDIVPCSCNILQSAGEPYFLTERQDKRIMKTLEQIAKKIEDFQPPSEEEKVSSSTLPTNSFHGQLIEH